MTVFPATRANECRLIRKIVQKEGDAEKKTHVEGILKRYEVKIYPKCTELKLYRIETPNSRRNFRFRRARRGPNSLPSPPKCDILTSFFMAAGGGAAAMAVPPTAARLEFCRFFVEADADGSNTLTYAELAGVTYTMLGSKLTASETEEAVTTMMAT